MRSLFAGLVLGFGSTSFAHAQNWTPSSAGVNEGTSYRQSNKADTPLIRVMRISEIEEACSCDFVTEAGQKTQDQIEFGLSTLWIDAYDLTQTKHNSTAHLLGDAETENGSRKILAGFYGSGLEPELRVYLDTPESFKLSDAKTGLSAISSPKSTPPAKTAKPKRMSGADLLAGVRRDVEGMKARSSTSENSPASKPKSGSRSGNALLAGIRKDVYGPSIEREKQRVIARKAAQDKLLREAIVSGKYKEPIVLKTEDNKKYIANWADNGTGIKVAKANDPRAPRMSVYSFEKAGGRWNSRATYERELKKSGLSAIKLEGPETLEVTEKFMSQFSSIVSGKAKRAGQPVRVFANIGHNPKTGITTVTIYDAPLKQWKDWGGIAPVMTRMSVHDQGAFSPAARAELSAMTPKQEIEVFEEHYTGRMISLFQGLVMTQGATLNSMRSFNMSTATCAGMENCTVSPDGVGGFNAEID